MRFAMITTLMITLAWITAPMAQTTVPSELQVPDGLTPFPGLIDPEGPLTLERIQEMIRRMMCANNPTIPHCRGVGEPEPPAEEVSETEFREMLKDWERGYSRTQYAIGMSLYLRGDYVEAVRWFRMAAEKGLVEAQGLIGTMYAHDNDETNDTEAVRWLRKAGEQGHIEAQNNLGVFYADTAVKWFCKAAQEGNPKAIRNLNVMGMEVLERRIERRTSELPCMEYRNHRLMPGR